MEIKALARGREVSFYRAARRVLCSAPWRPRLKLTISAESRVGGTAHAHDFLSSKSMPVHKRLLDSCNKCLISLALPRGPLFSP